MFLSLLRQRSVIGAVFDDRTEVLGFMIYSLRDGELDLLRLAVNPFAARQGIGARMVQRLIAKLYLRAEDTGRMARTRITARIREQCLDAQLFFRSQGFVATGLSDGDIHFVYDISPEW